MIDWLIVYALILTNIWWAVAFASYRRTIKKYLKGDEK